MGADQGFRAASRDQESVRDSGHEDSASARIAAGQRPRPSFRHPQASSPWMRRYPRVGFSAARRSASRQSSADVDGRPGGRCGWVQCPTMRRRCQRNSVSGVTSHPVRLGRASAAAIAPSKLRSASVSSGRSICRRSTASWWRNTMISRSFQRPDRTVSRASDANNRYKIRYTRTQHRPASRQVNDHGRVSGTHTPQTHFA